MYSNVCIKPVLSSCNNIIDMLLLLPVRFSRIYPYFLKVGIVQYGNSFECDFYCPPLVQWITRGPPADVTCKSTNFVLQSNPVRLLGSWRSDFSWGQYNLSQCVIFIIPHFFNFLVRYRRVAQRQDAPLSNAVNSSTPTAGQHALHTAVHRYQRSMEELPRAHITSRH